MMMENGTNNTKTAIAADAVVVGAGPAGLAAAIALGASGCKTVCVGQKFNADPARPDTRTTALLQTSVLFLRNLGVWHRCAEKAAPLTAIRMIDDTGRLLRAPDIEFHSDELGTGPFGHNIINSDLVGALLETAQSVPLLRLIETRSAAITRIAADHVHVETAEGQRIDARLVAAADGRNSGCRDAAGIATKSWAYEQTAMACNFEHTEPHGSCSNEFHRMAGPFTTVPLPGNASSLVWVERPDTASSLMQIGDEEFRERIAERLHGLLGQVTGVGPRASFPLSGLTPAAFARNRVSLVGEAAHVIPPIGAQGLNLGFRDAATLAEHASRAVTAGRDPGSDAALSAYHNARRGDVLTRTIAVDLLNRSLLADAVPLQALRGAGLHLLKRIAPLRRLAMRQGVAPALNLPELMQGQPAGASVSGN